MSEDGGGGGAGTPEGGGGGAGGGGAASCVGGSGVDAVGLTSGVMTATSATIDSWWLDTDS